MESALCVIFALGRVSVYHIFLIEQGMQIIENESPWTLLK